MKEKVKSDNVDWRHNVTNEKRDIWIIEREEYKINFISFVIINMFINRKGERVVEKKRIDKINVIIKRRF